jgi:hypothetical protein
MAAKECSPRLVPLADILIDLTMPRLDVEAEFPCWRLRALMETCQACGEPGWVCGLSEGDKATGYDDDNDDSGRRLSEAHTCFWSFMKSSRRKYVSS